MTIWSPMAFGKHKGKALPQILFADPDWFFWAWDESVFDRNKHLKEQATRIHKRATSIKVSSDGSKQVEYLLHPSGTGLAVVDIIPSSKPAHVGSSPSYRKDRIDLSFARKIVNYDKLGSRIAVATVKEHFFGSSSARATKRRCENFFNNPQNFLSP